MASAQSNYPDLPQVWQATSALISYKSEVFSGVSHLTGNRHIEAREAFILTNCKISLETLAENFAKGILINGKPPDFVFINCIVHYSGGEYHPKI
jgi:hypothetical protein